MSEERIRAAMPSVLQRAAGHSAPIKAILRNTTYSVSDRQVEIAFSSQPLVQVAERHQVAQLVAQYVKTETGLDVQVSLVVQARPDDTASAEEGEEKADTPPTEAAPRPSLEEMRKSAAEVNLEEYWAQYRKQLATAPPPSTKKPKAEEPQGNVVKGNAISPQAPVRRIATLTEEENNVVIEGEVFGLGAKETKTGKQIIAFGVSDLLLSASPSDIGSSIVVKIIRDPQKEPDYLSALKNGVWVKIRGNVAYDRFSSDLNLIAYDVMLGKKPDRTDDYDGVRRIELHAHTQMSEYDGLIPPEKLVERAVAWGHKAVAITDHAVVQGFPAASHTKIPDDFKLIYGCTLNVVDDTQKIIERAPQNLKIADATFVVLDIETTGFSPLSDDIIELGAVRMQNGQITDAFQSFVKPSKPIPPEVQKLTNITEDMVADAPGPAEALRTFFDFVGDAIVVAHNAQFDYSFLRYHRQKHLGEEFNNPVLDTLTLARALLPNLRSHNLANLTKHLNVPLVDHHRADADAKTAAMVLQKLLEMAPHITEVEKINTLTENRHAEQARPVQVTVLVKNQKGMKNLYKLISLSHTQFLFRGRPRVPKSVLEQYREGLLLGSGTNDGALYDAVLRGVPDQELVTLAQWYDYLEVVPKSNLMYLVEEGQVPSEEQLHRLNQQIYDLGKKTGRLVVAVGDAHFLDPHEQVFRKILKALKNVGWRNGEKDMPLYFRTTQEMLAEFAPMGEAVAKELVIENPHRLVEQIEKVKPVPDKLYPPILEGSEEQTRALSYAKVKRIYGDPIPEKIAQRLEKELNAIIGNGFAVSYYISHLLIKKSLEMGYLVGSRGSVGSSFVAWAMDISEVNPLPPHYVCPNCHYLEWYDDGNTGSGFDLPNKPCPQCGTQLIGDGQDIPFETFLGFKGDKVPDIDLNFSGEVQNRIQKYSEELLGGEKYVFKAGTVGTIADKTAYGMAKGWLEESGIRGVREAHIGYLANGIVGVKRTTGQHPGGMVVCPVGMDIEEVTPIQYPANDESAGVRTTHFDYHSFEQALMKLDILGHDDPTILKMLQDLYREKHNDPTFDVRNLPMNDPKVLRLFSPGGQEVLGLKEDDLKYPLGTVSLPEMGTNFVRQMLMETSPSTFSDLVRISGLSHGTDVWTNNAQELIRKGICTLQTCIPTRDDIMLRLMYWGIEPATAFKIMESVRKGKGVPADMEELMRSNGVPDWYIESCKRIKYMFPKAHAAAYVISCLRIAWFKVYEPEMFYAATFTVRSAGVLDANLLVAGPRAVREHIERIEAQGDQASNKDRDSLTDYELVEEAFKRGIRFAHVDLYQSDATRYKILPDGKLLCPLNSLPGLAEAAATAIVEARKEGEFFSVDDLKNRARLNKSVIEALRSHGCLNGLPESNQLTIFSFI